MQKKVAFNHNLDEIPIEIRSKEDSVTTGEQKYIWFQGNVGQSFDQAKDSVDYISIAITVPTFSLWLANCNSANEKLFNPQPAGKEVILTIFKTATEVVIECDGVLCAKYTYSESTRNDNRCNVFTLPTRTLSFVDHSTQVATEFRVTGLWCYHNRFTLRG